MICTAFLVKSLTDGSIRGMPSAAASAILEGMPEAADLRVLRSDGMTWVFAGKTALFRFADGDSAMRNIAVAALRQIGFSGTQVAAALGLTTNYVATLHQRARRDGDRRAGPAAGRPRTVTGQDWEQARAWRAAGVRDAEIARGLGCGSPRCCGGSARPRCKPSWRRGTLPLIPARLGGEPGGPAAGAGTAGRCRGRSRGSCRRGWEGQRGPAEGSGVFSRYAGAMLLHAYPGRAGDILPQAAGGDARQAALLSAVSTCSARCWGQPPPSRSSTWPRPRPGRWPGWKRCRRCGRCARRWPRSPAPPARWNCRRHWPERILA